LGGNDGRGVFDDGSGTGAGGGGMDGGTGDIEEGIGSSTVCFLSFGLVRITIIKTRTTAARDAVAPIK
jgi:hypothetical protein